MLLLLSIGVRSQVIKYNKIADLSLCISDTVIVSIKNNKETPLSLNEVFLKLPCDLQLKELLSEGQYSPLSDKVRLTLPTINAGQEYKLIFIVLAPCDILSCIDNGDLFRYELTIETKNYSSPFFNIDAPGLNVISILPTNFSVTAGSNTTRTVKIKNTRPGKIQNFYYRDSTVIPYPGDDAPIDVIGYYNFGKVIRDNGYVLELLFDKETFQRIGNGDSYFDFNEEIVLVITYDFYLCKAKHNFDQYTSINWICEGKVCKDIQKFTQGYFYENNEFLVSYNTSDPTCTVGGEAEQEMIIESTAFEFVNKDIKVIINDTIDAIGIYLNSLTADFPISNIEYNNKTNSNCNLDAFEQVSFTIPEMQPKDVIKIKWKSAYCTNKVDSLIEWDFKILSDKACVDPKDFPLLNYFPTEFYFDKNKIFLNNKVDSIQHIVKSRRFENYNGKVRFTYTLPCNLEFMPGVFKNYNDPPTFIDINNTNGLNTLILEYKLPFFGHGVKIDLLLKSDCDKDCGSIIDSCGTVVVSSCNSLCTQAYVEQNINVKMEIIDTIIPCPNGYPITYFTEPLKTTCFDFACNDTLAAYLDHNFLFERANYGYADNNNDDVADVINNLDFTKVKKRTILVGDTLKFVQNGKIVVDKNDRELNYFTIQIDGNLAEFVGNNWPQQDELYKQLLYNGSFDFSDHNLLIKDKTNNRIYPIGIGEVVYSDSLENILIRYSISDLKNNNLIPQDYRFKTNDSLYFNAQVILRKNFPSQWAPSIPRRNIFSKMKVDLKFKTFFSESLVEDIDDIYICQCNNLMLEICSFYAHVNDLEIFADDDALYCEGQTMAIGFISNYYGIKPEIFTHEIRELFPVKGISVNTNGYLDVNKMHILAYSDDKLIYSNPNAVFNKEGDSTVHWFPENTIFGELTEIRMEIFMTLNQDINFNGLSDKINVKFIYGDNDLPTYFEPNPATLIYEVPFAFPDLKIIDSIFNIYDKRAEYTAKIFNEPKYSNTADNTFMYIDPNLNTDIVINRILFAKTGLEIQQENGLYQLGQVRPRENLDIIFDITSSSCKDEILNLYIGWSCDKVNSKDDKPTGEIKKIDILLKYFPGVIDMAFTNSDYNADLCSRFDTIQYNIINGEFGSIHDMRYKLELPRGMSFVSGTFTFKHPVNGQSISLPDPIDLGSNIFSFVFDDLLDKFDFHGLKGILNENEHILEITFIAETNCDFISGTKIIHRAEAKQKCGIVANRRAKVSPYFIINGLDKIENVDITPDGDITFDNCSSMVTTTLLLERTLTSDDKIWNVFFKIPEGVTITDNKIKVDGIDQTLTFDGIYFYLNLPPEKQFCTVSMNLWTTLSECEESVLVVFTTIPRNTLCVKSNSNCTIQQVTGDGYIPLSIRKPQYLIKDAKLISFNANRMNAAIEIENTGIASNRLINLKLLFDANGNFKPDHGEFILLDTFVKESFYPKFTLNINKDLASLQLHQLCNLMVVVADENNCICHEDYALFEGVIKVPFASQDICWNEIAELKFDGHLAGNSFLWYPLEDLSCSQCTVNYYNPADDFHSDSIKYFYFSNQITDRCYIEYEYIVNVNPKANIIINDSIFCKGDTVLLSSIHEKNNEWYVNNMKFSNEQKIEIVVEKPIFISLTNNRLKDCPASDNFDITPYEIPMFSAGEDRELCFKNYISLDPIVPENLDFIWKDEKGILSDVSIADPLILKNESSAYILQVCNNTCCDYDTVSINFSNGINFHLPNDTVSTCFGDTIKLLLESDLTYLWSDNVKPFCLNDDCNELSIPVEHISMVVSVKVIDSLNCTAEDKLFIEGKEYLFEEDKNIILCEGDSILINNQMVKSDGTYCDTVSNGTGCKVISCTNLIFNKIQMSSITQSICEGSNYIFYDQILNTPGNYCTTFQNQTGCDSTICVELRLNSKPSIILDSTVYHVARGSEIIIEEKGNQYNYQWISPIELSCNNCSNPAFFAEDNALINLVVANEFGCKDSTTIRINVNNGICYEYIVIPNVFTPNGNNRNDIFRIVNGENLKIHLFEIYNEWGQKIFVTNENGWDGMIEGALAPQATYAFVIKASCNDEIKTLTGYVTLLR